MRDEYFYIEYPKRLLIFFGTTADDLTKRHYQYEVGNYEEHRGFHSMIVESEFMKRNGFILQEVLHDNSLVPSKITESFGGKFNFQEFLKGRTEAKRVIAMLQTYLGEKTLDTVHRESSTSSVS